MIRQRTMFDQRALRFLVGDDRGWTQFVVLHGWYLDDKLRPRSHPLGMTAADVGYHSPTPRYEGQPAIPCDLLPAGECYYDGSSLRADDWLRDVLAGGDVWGLLAAEHAHLFGVDRSCRHCESSEDTCDSWRMHNPRLGGCCPDCDHGDDE